MNRWEVQTALGRFTVEFISNGTNSSFQSNNLSSDLRARGVTSVTRIRDIFDVDGALADVYNVFNSSAVLAVNTRYGPSWQQPFVTLQGRFFKAGLQADF